MKKIHRKLAVILLSILLIQTFIPVSASADTSGSSVESIGQEDMDRIIEEIEEEKEKEGDEENASKEEEDPLQTAKEALTDIVDNKPVIALVYLCEDYVVREQPGSSTQTVITVKSGQSVQITGVELDDNKGVWYKVKFSINDKEYKGFINKNNLAYSDEAFLSWEKKYPIGSQLKARTLSTSGNQDIIRFPESYQAALLKLKQEHPNWIFVPMNTGLDWKDVVKNELGEKSLVPSSVSSYWKGELYGAGWYLATEGILKYYLDPRNFLTNTHIFQFEQLTYNPTYHSASATQSLLSNTFMTGGIPSESRTYAQAFSLIGESLGVSPFHLACRVYQEQGAGTSPLISGTYTGYENLYNYFNVGASGKTTTEIITSGLKRARTEGWTTRYASLYGGSNTISKSYILKGQDTLYLQKFDVDAGYDGLYWHQYMQNIMAPSSEATQIRKAYQTTGSLNNTFVFKIPVYKNMPDVPCAQPSSKAAVVLDTTALNDVAVGKTHTLTAYVDSEKVKGDTMTWSSADKTIAAVDSNGKITAQKPGTTTISCTRSGAETASCKITVIKGEPEYTVPVPDKQAYRENLMLSDISLPNGWSWKNGTTKLSAGTKSYDAVFTPEDTQRYETVTVSVSLTVIKGKPEYTVPKDLSAEYGSKLSTVTLPLGFTWEDKDIVLNTTGKNVYYASYNPDKENYDTVTKIELQVEVIKESGVSPSPSPSASPSVSPSPSPSTKPSVSPSPSPSASPSTKPSVSPSPSPSASPSTKPSVSPSPSPSASPSTKPSVSPSPSPSASPSTKPSVSPSPSPSTKPSVSPSPSPSVKPSVSPSPSPSVKPSVSPSPSPSVKPSVSPSPSPSVKPSVSPSSSPSAKASASPKATAGRSSTPSPTAQVKQPETKPATILDKVVDAIMNPGGAENPVISEGVNPPQVTVVDDAVVIDLSNDGILSEDVLRLLVEHEAKAVLTMNEYASWGITAKDILSDNVAEYNMGVEINNSTIPDSVKEQIVSDYLTVELSLAHNGEFGFECTLTLKIEDAVVGQYANLYYFNEENDEMEFICSVQVDQNNNALFLFEHASEYLVVVTDEPIDEAALTELNANSQSNSADVTEDSDSKETDQKNSGGPDAFYIILGVIILVGIVAVCIVILVMRRRYR